MALRQPHSLRPALSTAGISLGVALGGLHAAAGPAEAQQTTTTTDPNNPNAVVLDTVVITSTTGTGE